VVLLRRVPSPWYPALVGIKISFPNLFSGLRLVRRVSSLSVLVFLFLFAGSPLGTPRSFAKILPPQFYASLIRRTPQHGRVQPCFVVHENCLNSYFHKSARCIPRSPPASNTPTFPPILTVTGIFWPIVQLVPAAGSPPKFPPFPLWRSFFFSPVPYPFRNSSFFVDQAPIRTRCWFAFSRKVHGGSVWLGVVFGFG